ncbi:MAG: hypothetical protein R3E66_14195 [bacterium]
MTIGNKPPLAEEPRITPARPTTLDALSCGDASVTDADGQAVSVRYAWKRNGEYTGDSTSILPFERTIRGESWVCEVTPHDGIETGQSVSSAPVVVLNSPPSVPAIAVNPTDPRSTDDVLCEVVSESEDPDLDPLTYVYEWRSGTGAISPGPSLSAAATSKDEAWTCFVLVSDGELVAEAQTSVNIANSPPSAPGVALSPTSPNLSESISCLVSTPAVDPDGDEITYSYMWTKFGFPTGNTSPTLDFSNTAKGEEWACVVSASDGNETGPSGTAETIIVNRAPSAPTVKIAQTAPLGGEALDCVIETASVDADGDAVTYEYSWIRDGVDAGIYSAGLPAFETSKGQQWTCSARASDGTDVGPVAVSDFVLISMVLRPPHF